MSVKIKITNSEQVRVPVLVRRPEWQQYIQY